MKMNDVTNAADGLDEKNRSATVKLIDLKVEDDMEKILKTMHTEFSLIHTELSLMKSEINHLDKRIATVYWVVGLSTALLGIIMAIK